MFVRDKQSSDSVHSLLMLMLSMLSHFSGSPHQFCLFSCLIEGCCDTAIQGCDCRGQHSSDQVLYINLVCQQHVMFSNIGMLLMVLMLLVSFHGQLLAALDAGEFAAKSALVKEGSVTLMNRSFAGQFVNASK